MHHSEASGNMDPRYQDFLSMRIQRHGTGTHPLAYALRPFVLHPGVFSACLLKSKTLRGARHV